MVNPRQRSREASDEDDLDSREASKERAWRHSDEDQLESEEEVEGAQTVQYLSSPAPEEDWDREISESFPYGPEDVSQEELEQCAWQPGEPLYSPASHHAPPVPWVPVSAPVVRGQFSDVEK
ncbi:coordinator of PRMT5 and differentiation stimulator-like [Lepisosteus oculatus]|uniref:coordinator of PRMT5 and differentiation stimulator-like n=1 Tax=Lepisosteus oculatus TaxID=7918 RepID=UPI00371EA5AD